LSQEIPKQIALHSMWEQSMKQRQENSVNVFMMREQIWINALRIFKTQKPGLTEYQIAS